MSGLTLGARRTSRIPAGKLGQTAPPEPKEPIVDFKPAKLFVSAYEHLVNKNPALKLLAEKLDLVEVSSTGTPGAISLPELPKPVVMGPVSPKLKELAIQAFEPNNTYNEETAIVRLSQVTKVSIDRAQKGLAMMLDQNLVALTLSSEYYLAESTPF